MERLGVGRQAEVFAVSDTECVKLYYPGVNRREVEDEARRMRFVSEHGVPSPAFIALEELDGRYGIRMERLHGVTLLYDALENFQPDVDYGGLLGSIQRQYHQVRAEGLGDMVDSLTWMIRQTELLVDAEKDELVRRLLQMPRGDRLVHLDYHSDNVIMTPSGMKVIDWAGACAGNPLADAARTLLMLELSSYPMGADETMRKWLDDTRDICRAMYLRGYGAPLEQINAWKPFIAAARLFCSPPDERGQNERLVRALLAGR